MFLEAYLTANPFRFINNVVEYPKINKSYKVNGNMSIEELENRITLYAITSRLMLIETDARLFKVYR